MHGRRVYLIDTPGFDDFNRSNTETLSILASYLGASYANGVRIHGIIYLHPIFDNREAGSHTQTLEIIRAMCQFDSCKHFAIATTMWPTDLNHNEKAVLLNRELGLRTDPFYYGSLTAEGATVFRHNEKGRRDSYEEMISAQKIVGHLLSECDEVNSEALLIQREIIDQGKRLGETAAGCVVGRELITKRQTHERQRREIEGEMRKELAQEDPEHAAELRALREEVGRRLGRLDGDMNLMVKFMQDMHEDEESYWQDRIEGFRKHLRNTIRMKARELRNMEECWGERRKGRGQRAQAAIEFTGYEEAARDARLELEEAHAVYQEFFGSSSSTSGEEMHNGTDHDIGPGLISEIINSSEWIDIRY